MAHRHSIYDTDPHFLIDPATRQILNKSTTKTSIIQYDHNSERFTFEVARTIDGHDMSLCDKVEIHYVNTSANRVEQSADVYIVDDLQISPDADDVVIFSWLLSQNATKYEGTLHFLVKFICLSGTTVEYAWNTAIFSAMSVGMGMYNSEHVVEEYSDVFESYKPKFVTPNVEVLNDVLYITNNDDLNEHKPSLEFTQYISGGRLGMAVSGRGTVMDAHIVVPATYKGDVVDSIGSLAFVNDTTLESIEFYYMLKYIRTQAFMGCTNLTKVILPNNLEIIEPNAFNGSGIRAITIPATTHVIYDSAFNNCTNLTSVRFLGDYYQSLGDTLFYNCPNLKDIFVPWGEDTNFGEPWGANATIHYNSEV